MTALKLLLALLPAAPPASPPVQPAPGPAAAPATPPFVARCLGQLRPAALEQGAPLPIDSPKNADYGTCAAQCEGHCFLAGDFDGDGRPRELAVASPSEVLLFHDVERGKGRRFRATLAGRLQLSGEEVALLPWRRAARFADEVGLLRDGHSPLPPLSRDRGERPSLGLILWRGLPPEDAPAPEEGEDSHGVPSESGELLVAVFDPSAHSYRLQRVLQLGAP